MSTVRSADGTTIAYTRACEGPPLILVDGALCSRSFGPMPKLAEQLAAHFTVYTYDRRGRGASSDTKPYAPDREVEDIEALVAVAATPCSCTAPRPARLAGGGQAYPCHREAGPVRAALDRRRLPDRNAGGYRPPRLEQLVADNRPGDAVKMFMRFVGAPAVFTAVMPITPSGASSRRPRRPCRTTLRSCTTISRERR